MKILVTNDDGVHARGIRVLAETLKVLAEVTVVAPDRNRSGSSSALTLTAPLRTYQLDNGYWSVEGTPTDCVHLGISGLFKTDFDMVVSGINDGSNLGDDVWYSGTVAAAMEGRFLGLPAIAVSLASKSNEHLETAAAVVRRLVLRLQKDPLPGNTILNVNVPDLPPDALQGMEVCRLGTRHCAEHIIPGVDPRGHPIYWVGPAGAEQDAGPGTDFNAIARGFVAITPLRLDITHYETFEQLSKWITQL